MTRPQSWPPRESWPTRPKNGGGEWTKQQNKTKNTRLTQGSETVLDGDEDDVFLDEQLRSEKVRDAAAEDVAAAVQVHHHGPRPIRLFASRSTSLSSTRTSSTTRSFTPMDAFFLLLPLALA